MKSLIELTNTEKGRLLADLFPEELEPLVQSVLITCQYFMNHEDEIKDNWINGFTTLEFWKSTIRDVEVICRLKIGLSKSSKIFSEQLFYGNAALFTMYCISQYASRENSNKKFQQAVQLVFD